MVPQLLSAEARDPGNRYRVETGDHFHLFHILGFHVRFLE